MNICLFFVYRICGPCQWYSCLFSTDYHASDEQRLHLPSLNQRRNLPIHLTDEILNKLSFRDDLRTSTLSEDWKYTCCRFLEVKFDQKV